MMPMTLSPTTPPVVGPAASGSSLPGAPAVSTVNGVARPKMKSLPLINEFDPSSSSTLLGDVTSMNSRVSMPLRTVSGSTTSSSTSTANSFANNAADLNLIPLEELDYVKLATDQFGCRFLQKKLESPQECHTVRDLMYHQIHPFFLELILDPFGNYLVQKLCEFLTTDQKTQLIQGIYPHVFQISINQYGTRSLQKIIDTVETEAQIDMIIRGFSQQFTSIDQVVVLINDLNGNHVVQKCIFKFPPTKFDFIIDAIVDQSNIIKISTHKHGCCVLQKLLSVCTLQQIFKISVKIIQFLPGLINDQFGNYIIQFLLEIKELDFYLLGEIFNKLSNELCQLSCLKFSSNVVEKFVKKLFNIVEIALTSAAEETNDDVTGAAMKILLTVIDIFTANLNILIRDNFGNYALQTLLDVKNYSNLLEYPGNPFVHTSTKFMEFGHEFTLKVGNLVVLTKELLPSIKTTSYAKKIKLKIKAYAELTGVSFTDITPKKGSYNHNHNGHNFNHNHNSNNHSNGNSHNNNNSHNHGNTHNSNHNSSHNNHSGNHHHRKQHSRHYSLPANAYRHRRNSSSMSVSSTMAQPSQPQALGFSGSQNSSAGNINGQFAYLNEHASGSFTQPPTSQIFPPQQPQASLYMNNPYLNVPNASTTVNSFAFHEPQQPLQITGVQENQSSNFLNPGKHYTPQAANMFMSGKDFQNMNFGNSFY